MQNTRMRPHRNYCPSAASGRRSCSAGLVALLLTGVVLYTCQALRAESLWRDEVALGLNLDDRGLLDLLLRPLDHHQMAPPGFLGLAEMVTEMCGGSTAPDFAFRCVPWLLGLAGLAAALAALGRLVQGWPLVFGLLPFALGTGAYYYGAAVKSYGADITACLLLLWAALRLIDQPTGRRGALLGGWLAGPALLLSFPAVPLAGCLALVLGLHTWRGRDAAGAGDRLRTWLLLAVPWGFFATLSSVFVLRLRRRPIHDFLLDYWQTGFPVWDHPLEAGMWLPRHVAGVVQHFLFFRAPELAPGWVLVWMKAAVALLLLLAAWGLVSTTRRHPWHAAVLAAPLAVAALLATCRLYPYLERLGLWTAPSILLPAAVALGVLWRRNTAGRILATGVVLTFALPILLSSFWLQPPPIDSQSLRPVIEELTRRVQPGDMVYVPCGGGQLGLRFYARRTGLDDLPVKRIEGACHSDRAGYLAEATALAGRRVWLFHSHRPRGHAEWVLNLYLQNGVEVDRIEDPSRRTGPGSTRAFLFVLDWRDQEP